MAADAQGRLLPNAPQTGWRVTGQSQTMGLDGNRAVEGYKVMFATSGGHEGSVFVPTTRYTPDNVRAAIAQHAAVLDLVGGLSSPAPQG